MKKTESLKKSFFSITLLFFSLTSGALDFTSKLDFHNLYADQTGDSFCFDFGAGLNVPVKTEESQHSFYLSADYLNLQSNLKLISGNSHNLLLKTGVSFFENQNNKNWKMNLTGFTGNLPDSLKLDFTKLRLSINNLNYIHGGFCISSPVVLNSRLETAFFAGKLDSKDNDFYLFNGKMDGKYLGSNLKLLLPFDISTQALYTNFHSDLSTEQVSLGYLNLSLFNLTAKKSMDFKNHHISTILGFMNTQGDGIIKGDSSTQPLIIFPFNYFNVNGSANLSFMEFGADYKFFVNGFTFETQALWLLNLHSNISYFYKYTMKKSSVIPLFDGSVTRSQGNYDFSNGDSLLFFKLNAMYDFNTAHSNIALYIQKSLPIPFLTSKTRELFNPGSSSKSDNNNSSASWTNTILLSGLSIGCSITLQ